uniref:Target of myb1 like 2 membrane trafficking protein n=1 Tax=Cyprinus carpio TaxID=7962 RepID=A0A8C1JEK8_CYPCA
MSFFLTFIFITVFRYYHYLHYSYSVCGLFLTEKATDGSLQNEDWTLNMEICDIINETEEGPKDAMRAVKKRLNGNRNFREVMLALTVLETCVKNCGHRFHVHVANRDFIEGVLVKIITPKTNPPAIVQDKVLSLIQNRCGLETRSDGLGL